jgi:DNA-binding GntR family transcriptional regulator
MRPLNSATDQTGDRSSRPVPLSRGTPAYLQIEEQLADRIEGGEFAPGDRLPTERELSEQLEVSRMTVRAAMDRLVQRDLIVRRQGKGTFVAEEKLRQDASKLQGFFENTVGQGILPVSRLLERREVFATRHLAGILDVSVGEPLYRVVRLRGARGVAVVLETSYFPAAVVPGLLANGPRAFLDLPAHGPVVRCASGPRSSIARGRNRPGRGSRCPGHPAGEPGDARGAVSWDALDRTVEYARDLYHPDRSRFVAELTL